jgi:hypothetical protein
MLKACGVEDFLAVNVLEDPESGGIGVRQLATIRSSMSTASSLAR